MSYGYVDFGCQVGSSGVVVHVTGQVSLKILSKITFTLRDLRRPVFFSVISLFSVQSTQTLSGVFLLLSGSRACTLDNVMMCVRQELVAPAASYTYYSRSWLGI